MKVEEKLQIFRQMSLEDAEARCRRELAACRASLKEAGDEYRREHRRKASEQVQEETARIRREETLRVSEVRTEARRELAERERELSKTLFARVEEKLAAFRRTPAYADYLVKKAKEACAFAKGEELRLFLDEEDRQYFGEIEAAAGICPEISPEKLGGGIRALLPGRRIRLDDSWDALLADARANFRFEGGGRA